MLEVASQDHLRNPKNHNCQTCSFLLLNWLTCSCTPHENSLIFALRSCLFNTERFLSSTERAPNFLGRLYLPFYRHFLIWKGKKKNLHNDFPLVGENLLLQGLEITFLWHYINEVHPNVTQTCSTWFSSSGWKSTFRRVGSHFSWYYRNKVDSNVTETCSTCRLAPLEVFTHN